MQLESFKLRDASHICEWVHAAGGKPFLAVQLYRDTIPVLREVSFGFDLLRGTQVEEAKNLAEMLNEHTREGFAEGLSRSGGVNEDYKAGYLWSQTCQERDSWTNAWNICHSASVRGTGVTLPSIRRSSHQPDSFCTKSRRPQGLLLVIIVGSPKRDSSDV